MSDNRTHTNSERSSSEHHNDESNEDDPNSPQRHQPAARIAGANKSTTPPRLYPPSSAPQQHMQHYPSPYFPTYHHPSGGSPAPPVPPMYPPQLQQQRSYGGPTAIGPPGGSSGNPPYVYMPQQYPPNGPQGGDSPSQTGSMGNPNSPSAGGTSMVGPPMPYGGGPTNNGTDPASQQQHGHPPPPNYPFHHQQQWNYGPPYSGMSPGGGQMPYPGYGASHHDGSMPPPAQPYAYNNNWQQQPPPYYNHHHHHHQAWNNSGMPPPSMNNTHTNEHSSMPHPGSLESAGGGKVIPHALETTSSNSKDDSNGGSGEGPSPDENKIEGLAGPPSGLKRSRPISQEMLKSVTSPAKLPDSPFQAPKSPSEIQNSQREEIETMGCTCKKTNCLKLYCQCFGVKIYCGNNCRCSDCHNMPDYEEQRQDAMASIMSRNPVAFVGKYKKDKVDMAAHRLGCKCRKSACLKKYCECFAGGVNCSKACRCVGCKNLDGKAARQMQALERAQLAERQRQKTQLQSIGATQPRLIPPRPQSAQQSAPSQSPGLQPLQPYYPQHQYQYPPPHHLQAAQHPAHQQQHPQYQAPSHHPQPSPPQSNPHQFSYQPQHYQSMPPNMPNHYVMPPQMGYPQQMATQPSPPAQQQQNQGHPPSTETSWDAAQSLTFLKRSSPASNHAPDKETNDLRMAAAMALTGFGQSPSAPPSGKSLVATPIRSQEEDANPIENSDRHKRTIDFDDDEQGDSKRHKTQDRRGGRGRNNEKAEYGSGGHHEHHHHRNNPDVARNEDSPKGGTGPTEIAYV